jgi:phenylalanyl-tRNA synthetase alpha chain
MGAPPTSGYLHPLMKVRAEYREIFLGMHEARTNTTTDNLIEMGFEEMPTNNFVESSFWNFDTLFQPQQHPARDAHDTFFLDDPQYQRNAPEDYVKRVHEMHQHGGAGSIGWRYPWSLDESKKNILRTHTTAVSARMLYQLAQDGFKPKKYFSIDRVFRNESLDATHLAEFHQIEGLICDYNINLSHLIGVLNQFFEKTGLDQLRFKPAYNPYTEPSMEVFSFHHGLGKWVEVGNSGVFRPEMLIPMGLPEGVSVIAWGLSLERPTMIRYKFDNIRDIFGHKIDFGGIQSNPLCMLEKPNAQ